MALTDVPVELSSTPSIVDGGNATAITIDSSENVGLGTVPSGYLTNGYILRLNGGTQTYLGFNNSTHTTQAVGGFVIGNDASAARITQRENQPLIIATNDTEHMQIDSGGNAIFTKSGGAYLQLKDASAVRGAINVGTSDGLVFTTGSSFTSRMRIESSGNVAIGTSGVSAKLHIAGSPQATNGALVFLRNNDATSSNTSFGGVHFSSSPGTDFSIGKANVNAATSLSFRNGNTGASLMDLDSSGKLLVGTTSGSGSSAPDNSSSASDAGVRISGDGYIGIGNNTNQSLYLNIIGADGAIADFRKNGTTVGYISTIGGDFVVGSTSGSDAALRMDGTNNQIYPSNATGSSRDNAISLGASNVRFKDLYLSGGINFGDASGGTSYSAGNAANLLDDYEEGTWTPTIAHNDGSGSIPLTVSEASYTKVGGLVYVRGYLTLVNPNGNAGTSSPYYGIRNFPFDPTNYGSWNLVYTSGGNASYGGYSSSASFYFLLPSSSSPHGTGHVSGTAFNAYGSNLTMMFDAVYRTNA